ncbi:MAG: hypothetical protein KAG14_03555 [Mycoplasmataceae bacterium]|nr:hypothetical protein [Mycoplasmataceae bacterium]
MKYDLNFEDLLNLLENLVGKKRKRTRAGLPKGMIFNPLDVFHPGMAAILKLIRFATPELIKGVYAKTEESINMIEDYMWDKSKLKEDWGTDFFELWLPFAASDKSLSLRESYDQWASTDDLGIPDEQVKELKDNHNMTDEEIEALLDQAKRKITLFLSFLGESYANSITHGINTSINNINAPMLSLISQKIDLKKNTEKWVMLHIDIGMTILDNLNQKATDKITGMNNYEILRWVMKIGSSSKPDTQKIKGGGFTVMKEILILNGKLEILSGPYHISVLLLDKEIKAGEHDIEKITKVSVKQLNYRLPGTLVWSELNIDNNKTIHSKKLVALNDKIKKKREERLKEFIDE